MMILTVVVHVWQKDLHVHRITINMFSFFRGYLPWRYSKDSVAIDHFTCFKPFGRRRGLEMMENKHNRLLACTFIIMEQNKHFLSDELYLLRKQWRINNNYDSVKQG